MFILNVNGIDLLNRGGILISLKYGLIFVKPKMTGFNVIALVVNPCLSLYMYVLINSLIERYTHV